MPSEFGFTVLDTRDLKGLTMTEWRNKIQLSTYHFRIQEVMNVRPQNPYSRKVMHPDKFQFSRSQILPEKQYHRLLDTFFRIPADVESVAEYLAEMTRKFAQIRLLHDLWTTTHRYNN